MNRPVRTRLKHETPDWVSCDAVFFLTVCAKRRGRNILAVPEYAARILEATRHRRDFGKWWPFLLVVMPDHLHMLVSFPIGGSMKRTVADWKRWLAADAGIEWQDGFFDHRLRAEESFDEKAHYIRMNPVRAGLVEDWTEWKYTWDEEEIG